MNEQPPTLWGMIRSWHIQRPLAPFSTMTLCGRPWSAVGLVRDADQAFDPDEPTCETCLRIAARLGLKGKAG